MRRSGRRPGRPTCSSCFSTTSGSARPPPSAGRARPRPPSGSRRRRAAQPVPHHGAVRPDPAGPAHRAQPPLVGMGAITEMATAAPGNNSVRPRTRRRSPRRCGSTATSTAQFGKCHEVPAWQVTPMGPFDQWPTGSGFEHFYGFVGARPTSTTRASTRAPPRRAAPHPEDGYAHRGPRRPGDHLGAAAEGADAGQAVLRLLRARRDARPAPRAAGVVGPLPGPLRRGAGTCCASRRSRGSRSSASYRRTPSSPPGTTRSPPGTTCPTSQAGAGAADGDLRRLPGADRPRGRPAVDAIDDLGLLEDTLVFYIIGDNGASAEGTVNGAFNEMTTLNGMPASRASTSC